MLTEAISKIEQMTAEAHRFVKLQDLPRETLYDNGSGEVVRIAKHPDPRKHRVLSLDSLVAATHRFSAENPDDVSVWVDNNKILVLLDDQGFRHDQITMGILCHSAFLTLSTCDWMDQRKFVDLLRHSLADCMIDPDNTLDVVRMLKFATNTEATGEFDATTAKMGKSVHAQVTGKSALPETVTVSFDPYPGLEDLNCTVSIVCTLFVRPDEGTLKLEPQPGQIELAQRVALEAVATLVESNLQSDEFGCEAFIGTP